MDVQCGFEREPDRLMYEGPTLLVNIGFDPAYRSDETTIPLPGIRDVEALVDTGASESCVDSRLRSSLGLPIIDYQKVSGVHGEKEVPICMAQIDIPALKFTVYGHFAVVELLDGGQRHHALLGRSFLRHFAMTYNGMSGAVVIRSVL